MQLSFRFLDDFDCLHDFDGRFLARFQGLFVFEWVESDLDVRIRIKIAVTVLFIHMNFERTIIIEI